MPGPTATKAAKTGARTRRSAAGPAGETLVRDVMTERAVTVPPDLSVGSLRELLLTQGLSRVTVVDESDRAIGIVSVTDLVVESHVNGEAEVDRTRVPRGTHLQAEDKAVAEVMSKTVLSLRPDATIAQAAEQLVTHHLHGMPVCGDDGVVVGFLSSSDLLAWLAGLR